MAESSIDAFSYAAGELKDAAAVEAAAAYCQFKGDQISVEELTGLEIARKLDVGEPLGDHELDAVSGGWFVPPPLA
jgi:hypothetical protein